MVLAEPLLIGRKRIFPLMLPIWANHCPNEYHLPLLMLRQKSYAYGEWVQYLISIASRCCCLPKVMVYPVVMLSLDAPSDNHSLMSMRTASVGRSMFKTHLNVTLMPATQIISTISRSMVLFDMKSGVWTLLADLLKRGRRRYLPHNGAFSTECLL